MKIVVLDGHMLNLGDLSWKEFEKHGALAIYERTPADEIVKRIGDAEIILTNKTPLSAETLSRVPSVRYIGVLATGCNVVDVEAAGALSIAVTPHIAWAPKESRAWLMQIVVDNPDGFLSGVPVNVVNG